MNEKQKATRLALLGSLARDAGRDDGNVDILVSFNGPVTSERYFGTPFYLKDWLALPLDRLTEKALCPEPRPFVEREALHV